jgi:uncharacterized protein YutE (UPF0331/DUF86 family)
VTGFDKVRVERLVSAMREAVRLLLELRSTKKESFFEDEHLQSSAKYNFITAIEAAIDTANHIIATRALRSPRDYADAFKVLAESGVVDPEFAEELQKMARFRNRLVHLYWDVSLEEIWKLLQSRLGDFETYVHFVVKYLDSLDAPD